MPYCNTCDGHYVLYLKHEHRCTPLWHACPAPDEDIELVTVAEIAVVRGRDAQAAALDYINREYSERAPEVDESVTIAVTPDSGRTWKLVQVTAIVTLDTEEL